MMPNTNVMDTHEFHIDDEHSGFVKFCERRGIKLVPWQSAVAYLLLARGRGSGKTFLIDLLKKYEKEQSR